MVGEARRIALVASIPFIPGIRTSMKTMSGVRLADLHDGVLPAVGLADHDDVVRQVQGRVQPFPRDGMVVDDEDADGTLLPGLALAIGRQRVLLRESSLRIEADLLRRNDL